MLPHILSLLETLSKKHTIQGIPIYKADIFRMSTFVLYAKQNIPYEISEKHILKNSVTYLRTER